MNTNLTRIGWFGFATAVSAVSFSQINASADVIDEQVAPTSRDTNNFSNTVVKTADNETINLIGTFVPDEAEAAEVSIVSENLDQPETVDVENVASVMIEEEVTPIDTKEAFAQIDQDLSNTRLVGYNATITAEAAEASSSSTATADLAPEQPAPTPPQDNNEQPADSGTSDSLPETGQADETYLNIAGSLTMAVATLTMAKFIFRKRG